MRQDTAGEDSHRRNVVWPGPGVAAFADDPVRDVGVGADEVIRLDVLEDDPAVLVQSGPDVDLARRAPNSLEGLLQGQDETNRPPGLQRRKGDEGLVLGVLLPAEAAARIRGVDTDLREWKAGQLGDDLLQPVRMLDRAPDRDAIPVGSGHERMWLDREMSDDREGVGVLDDQVRVGRVDVTPPDAVAVNVSVSDFE